MYMFMFKSKLWNVGENRAYKLYDDTVINIGEKLRY